MSALGGDSLAFLGVDVTRGLRSLTIVNASPSTNVNPGAPPTGSLSATPGALAAATASGVTFLPSTTSTSDNAEPTSTTTKLASLPGGPSSAARPRNVHAPVNGDRETQETEDDATDEEEVEKVLVSLDGPGLAPAVRVNACASDPAANDMNPAPSQLRAAPSATSRRALKRKASTSITSFTLSNSTSGGRRALRRFDSQTIVDGAIVGDRSRPVKRVRVRV